MTNAATLTPAASTNATAATTSTATRRWAYGGSRLRCRPGAGAVIVDDGGLTAAPPGAAPLGRTRR